MRRVAAFALAISASSLAAPAAASPCAGTDATGGAVPAVEETILSQDWPALRRQLAAFLQDVVDATLADAEAVPVPYTSCEILFADRIPPGAERRVVVYHFGEEAVLFVYLETDDIYGEPTIVAFRYAPNMIRLMELVP